MLENKVSKNNNYKMSANAAFKIQSTYRDQWLLLIIAKCQLITQIIHGLLTLKTKKFVGNIFIGAHCTKLQQEV